MARDEAKTQQPAKNVAGAYLSPVSDRYAKEGLLAAKHRIEMCRLAVQSSVWISVDDWEATIPANWTPTVQLLEHFKHQLSRFPSVEIIPVLGSDLFRGFADETLWSHHEVSAILESFQIFVIDRQMTPNFGAEMKALVSENPQLAAHESRIVFVRQPLVNNLSSTLIRGMLRRNQSIKYLVSDAVEDYITKHRLFQKISVTPQNKTTSAVVKLL